MSLTITPVKVKGITIGKEPKICVPLVAITEDKLIRDAKAILSVKPDLIEWRVDYYNNLEGTEKVKNTLNVLQGIIGDYPIIFTCRIFEEGGFRKIDNELKINLAKEIIETTQIDIIDLELAMGKKIINEVIYNAHEKGVSVIISSHYFNSTPSMEIMIERLLSAQENGADIAKIAVMPTNYKDVLNLLEATLEFKEKYAKIPIVTMAMAGRGVISRIAGHLFGSAITFAAVGETSAPGQIQISELRTSIEILNKAL